MRSPICLLETQIAGAPFNVAPEKASRCLQYRDDHRFDVIFVDEKKFRIRVRSNKEDQHPEIVLPIASLEYLWSFSHHCWVLTQEYAAAQRRGLETFDCLGTERLKQSSTLLDWAKSNLLQSGVDQWPEVGPRPKNDEHSIDDSRVATELFLCALAWIMYHEIAHVVKNHPLLDTSISEQEEREADKFATNWLLDGLTGNDSRLRKRALGISVAVLTIQSLEIESVGCLKNTHPKAHDRIFNNTDAYKYENDEAVEAFCTVVLQYLFNEKSIEANVDGSKFSEILSDLLFDFSRVNSAGNNACG